MKHIASLLLCATLGLMAHQTAAQQVSTGQFPTPPASLLVITNVNVVDVVAGEILPNRMVVVRDGYITPIGPYAPGGQAVQRLDGRGKYLAPGLWNSHVQAPNSVPRERKLLARLVAHGITSICYFSAPPALLATKRAVEAEVQRGPRRQHAVAGILVKTRQTSCGVAAAFGRGFAALV